MLTLATVIEPSIKSPSHSNWARKKKVIHIVKGKVKLSLFADAIKLYIENPKDATEKLLELINEFSKVAWYKINIQKFEAFLYSNNKLPEKKN